MKYNTDSSKSVPDNPFILPNKYRCSTGVKFSQIQSNYGQIPTFLNISLFPLSTSMLLMITLPLDFGINEVSILNIVDLPAPLGPNKPNIDYYYTPNDTSLIAIHPSSYLFYNPNTLMGSSDVSILVSSSYIASSTLILFFISNGACIFFLNCTSLYLVSR